MRRMTDVKEHKRKRKQVVVALLILFFRLYAFVYFLLIITHVQTQTLHLIKNLKSQQLCILDTNAIKHMKFTSVSQVNEAQRFTRQFLFRTTFIFISIVAQIHNVRYIHPTDMAKDCLKLYFMKISFPFYFLVMYIFTFHSQNVYVVLFSGTHLPSFTIQ